MFESIRKISLNEKWPQGEAFPAGEPRLVRTLCGDRTRACTLGLDHTEVQLQRHDHRSNQEQRCERVHLRVLGMGTHKENGEIYCYYYSIFSDYLQMCVQGQIFTKRSPRPTPQMADRYLATGMTDKARCGFRISCE